MATIGLYSATVTGHDVGSWDNTAPHYANNDVNYRFTPSVNEEVYEVGIYEESDSSGAIAEIAVYDVSAGLPGTLVGSATVNAGGAQGWRSTSIGAPWALFAGTEYNVSIKINSGTWNYANDNTYQNNGYSRSNLTGASAFAATWTDDTQHHFGIYAYAFTQVASGSAPTITDVDTDEVVALGQTGVVITGTNFEASQGTGGVRINLQSDGLGADLPCTETLWADTSITVTVPVGLPPGPAYVFVQNDSGQENAVGFAVTLTAPAGYENFTYDGTSVSEPSETFQEMVLADHSVTMVNGDVAIPGTIADVAWSVDGTYTQSTPATVSADYYVWDASTETMYGPTAFTLAAQPGLSLPTLVSTGQNSMDLGVDTNVGSGTWYWYLSQSATPPSIADLKAGTGADDFGSQTVLATGTLSDSASGLSQGTTYYCHHVHDNAGVDSNVVTSAGVATDGSATLTADTGTYALTGTDAGLVADRVLTADPGSVLLTGLDAALTVSGSYTLTAEPGAYSLTGNDVVLTAIVVPEDYPDLPLDNDSERRPVNMTAINVTAAGTVRQRNFQSVELFEFTARHSLLTQVQAESVYALWSNNKKSAVAMVWAKDGLPYSVRFKGPPIIDRHQGNLWSVISELIGVAA
ncbi:MAG: DUF4082 domain-containing protein [Candidatus Thiodiazotropha sp. (ex Ctena orbiculata)]|nr:DUF4082 domain-containing protein [Candidatus Thiodiazotropha taylori]